MLPRKYRLCHWNIKYEENLFLVTTLCTGLGVYYLRYINLTHINIDPGENGSLNA